MSAGTRAGVPALPPGAVPRHAAEAVLDHGADRGLTLVCAPPGFGKTCTLAAWARSRPAPATAWVALGTEHADPHRLATDVVGALAALPGLAAPRPRPGAPRFPDGADPAATVAAGLAACPAPARLVLDDVQHLRDPPARAVLEALVRARRHGLRLVLSGRRCPALPLARLRLEERLVELRAEHLAFTPEETLSLLRGLGLRPSPAHVAVLHARTEGWPAGLRLAALRWRGHPDPDRFLDGFPGDALPVADLADEVLDGLGEPHRETLRRVCVAGRVPAGLAVALAGREDAAGVLDELARDTGLVRAGGPDDGFRPAELLRSHLVADLARRDPALLARLHRRAARWWGDRDRPATALAHAERAGDPDLLADLTVRGAARLLGRGEHDALERALAAAGTAGAHAPALLSALAHVHLARGRPHAAGAALRRAHRAGPVPAGGDGAKLRAATDRLLGSGGRIGAATGEAGPGRDRALAALARVARGAARLRGDDPGAVADLRAGVAAARRHGLDLLELQGLALLAPALWAVGAVPDAAAVADEALAAARVRARDGWPWAALARAVAAHAALLRGEPRLALHVLDGGARDASPRDGSADTATRWALRAARGGALVDLGERAAGLLELQAARGEAGDARVPAVLAVTAAVLEHGAALRLGHRTAAGAVADRLATRHPSCPEVQLLRARGRAAAGDHRGAAVAVAPLLDAGAGAVAAPTAVEAWLVAGRARLARGDRPGARDALRRALARAAPLDVRQPFARAGALRPLLVDELVPGAPGRELAARVLRARDDPRPAHDPPVALSARERDVLVRLPSLVNLDDIAGDLDVSINTVKTHVRALYGKLGVRTRRAAVLEAHERGLLA